jgi:hypothetical protein
VTQSAILPSASSDRRGVVGLLVLLFAITYLDRVCISVAGPRMQEDLGIGPLLLTRFLFIGPPVPDVKFSRDSRLRSMRLRRRVG